MRDTEQYGPSGEGAAERVPELVLLYSGARGVIVDRAQDLRPGDLPIGRAPGPDGLCLEEDSRASRLHAVIRLAGATISVLDQGSKNGVFVGGRRVSAAGLVDGDVLRIGDSFLLVRMRQAEQPDAEVVGLLGQSGALRSLRADLARLGPTSATVLLLGESGTGKEVAARALHELSGRGGAFLALNCGAIPETLAESQLFGHVAGAFTGAHAHPGYFRAAHRGTLFLDEIGEMPLVLQAKLLRVLEDHAVKRHRIVLSEFRDA